jgi:glucose/arabinose dehydrogenase
MNGRRLLLVISVSVLAGLWTILVSQGVAPGAGTLPDGFVQVRVTGGLTNPTTMAFAPDGRLFVAEQRGTLRIVKGGQLFAEPFLDISSRVDSDGERGLLGVAFDPNFSTNHYVYVYFTQEGPGATPEHNRVVRFTANGNRALMSSEKLILRLNNLSDRHNHNGGALNFGADGKLYVALGENADQDNSQSLDNLLGKMLRINKGGTIPKDNPFYDRASGMKRAIWALGLRNPYTFAVQPGTGRIHINDVGAHTWEEINRGAAGANYGWPDCEGNHDNPNTPGSVNCSAAPYTAPVYEYRHDGNSPTTGCAITGGAFYNPRTATFPAGYVGDYFFADFCSGWIRRLDFVHGTVTPFKSTSTENPVSLQVNRRGSLYFLARGTGSVEKISFVGS